MITIDIAKDFAYATGSRYYSDGNHSAEQFFTELLYPKFTEALAQESKLKIILDGGNGYTSSFLNEAFYLLGLKFGISKAYDNIIIISHEVPKYKEHALKGLAGVNTSKIKSDEWVEAISRSNNYDEPYEIVRVVKSPISKNDQMALILGSDNKPYISGAILCEPHPKTIEVLDTMTNKEQYEWLKSIRLRPFVLDVEKELTLGALLKLGFIGPYPHGEYYLFDKDKESILMAVSPYWCNNTNFEYWQASYNSDKKMRSSDSKKYFDSGWINFTTLDELKDLILKSKSLKRNQKRNDFFFKFINSPIFKRK
jgi:hypothetical protein